MPARWVLRNWSTLGNPIYDWEAMDKDGYQWWIERLRESFKIYDIVRIDHFRGFESYWEIPAGSETAAPGKWVKGPGYKLFAAVKEELGDLNIIAEDLGFMTDGVIELRERTGFPGMKILQFAFNPDDESIDSPHLAPNNSVMYTGTHDNNTVLGWYRNEIDDPTREYLARYTNRKEYESVPHAMLRTVFASVSFMAIATMQDLLELDGSARMNFPSTLGGNWSWRMTADQLTPAVEQELLDFTTIYRRENKDLKKKLRESKNKIFPPIKIVETKETPNMESLQNMWLIIIKNNCRMFKWRIVHCLAKLHQASKRSKEIKYW